jgi:hypothetical protein
MIYQKPKTKIHNQKPQIDIYKQLQKAIYFLIIYKKKIDIYFKISEKVMGFNKVEKVWVYRQKQIMRFIMEFEKSYKNKQQGK